MSQVKVGPWDVLELGWGVGGGNTEMTVTSDTEKNYDQKTHCDWWTSRNLDQG